MAKQKGTRYKNDNLPKFTTVQKQILIGILLGDAHLETQSKGNTYRLKVEQSLKHKLYVEHLYEFFKDYTKTEPKLKKTTNKINWGFSTLSMSKLSIFGKLFYPNNTKQISKWIYCLLSPRALAYWYMDDGSKKSEEHKATLLNTQGFSYEEVVMLCAALKKRFNLVCTPRKQANHQWQIYISGASYEIFRDLIYEYLIPDMQYKFPLPRKIR